VNLFAVLEDVGPHGPLCGAHDQSSSVMSSPRAAGRSRSYRGQLHRILWTLRWAIPRKYGQSPDFCHDTAHRRSGRYARAGCAGPCGPAVGADAASRERGVRPPVHLPCAVLIVEA
jgi:hypothetical protein